MYEIEEEGEKKVRRAHCALLPPQQQNPLTCDVAPLLIIPHRFRSVTTSWMLYANSGQHLDQQQQQQQQQQRQQQQLQQNRNSSSSGSNNSGTHSDNGSTAATGAAAAAATTTAAAGAAAAAAAAVAAEINAEARLCR